MLPFIVKLSKYYTLTVTLHLWATQFNAAHTVALKLKVFFCHIHDITYWIV